MASRVTINVTARDLTRAQLDSVRRNFRHLGDDIDRAVGARTRQNFDRLRGSLNASRTSLQQLRGNIPDEEFFRLDTAMRQAQRTMQRGFGNVGDAAFARLTQRLRGIDEEFRRVNASGTIRVRVDDSALRRADAQLNAWRRDNERRLRMRVRVDPDANRNAARLRRALGRPFMAAGGFLGGLMSDGIGQGIIGGLRGAGPVLGTAIGAVLLTAVAAALSFVGAAIAGLLVLAIGGAFVGLGAVFASQSEVIQRNWKAATKNMGADMTKAAEPLVPAMHRAIHAAEKIVDEFAPHFRKALTAAIPHVETFMAKIVSGFKKLGGEAAEPLEQAFNVLLAALGPKLEDTLAGMGDSLRALANTVTDNSEQIAEAINGIIGLITTMIDIVNFLANAWVKMADLQGQAVGRGMKMMATLVEFAIGGVQNILDAFSHIPFIGGQFAKARDAVRGFKEKVVADMRTTGQAFLDAGKKMDQLNKERKLNVNIRSFNARLAQARADLARTSNQKAEAKIKADISDLIKKKAAAFAALRAINGAKATTIINTVYTSENRTKYNPKTNQYYRATGGNVGIGAATGGARANMTMVGEQGPELVDFSAGRVLSNNKSRQIATGGGGGDMQPFAVYIDIGGSRLAELQIDPIRKIVKSRGGVRATFGEL